VIAALSLGFIETVHMPPTSEARESIIVRWFSSSKQAPMPSSRKKSQSAWAKVIEPTVGQPIDAARRASRAEGVWTLWEPALGGAWVCLGIAAAHPHRQRRRSPRLACPASSVRCRRRRTQELLGVGQPTPPSSPVACVPLQWDTAHLRSSRGSLAPPRLPGGGPPSVAGTMKCPRTRHRPRSPWLTGIAAPTPQSLVLPARPASTDSARHGAHRHAEAWGDLPGTLIHDALTEGRVLAET
jgi:hypothetical protein